MLISANKSIKKPKEKILILLKLRFLNFISNKELIKAKTGIYKGKITLRTIFGIISFLKLSLQILSLSENLVKQLRSLKVDNSWSLGFFIVLVFKLLKSIS